MQAAVHDYPIPNPVWREYADVGTFKKPGMELADISLDLRPEFANLTSDECKHKSKSDAVRMLRKVAEVYLLPQGRQHTSVWRNYLWKVCREIRGILPEIVLDPFVPVGQHLPGAVQGLAANQVGFHLNPFPPPAFAINALHPVPLPGAIQPVPAADVADLGDDVAVGIVVVDGEDPAAVEDAPGGMVNPVDHDAAAPAPGAAPGAAQGAPPDPLIQLAGGNLLVPAGAAPNGGLVNAVPNPVGQVGGFAGVPAAPVQHGVAPPPAAAAVIGAGLVGMQVAGGVVHGGAIVNHALVHHPAMQGVYHGAPAALPVVGIGYGAALPDPAMIGLIPAPNVGPEAAAPVYLVPEPVMPHGIPVPNIPLGIPIYPGQFQQPGFPQIQNVPLLRQMAAMQNELTNLRNAAAARADAPRGGAVGRGGDYGGMRGRERPVNYDAVEPLRSRRRFEFDEEESDSRGGIFMHSLSQDQLTPFLATNSSIFSKVGHYGPKAMATNLDRMFIGLTINSKCVKVVTQLAVPENLLEMFCSMGCQDMDDGANVLRAFSNYIRVHKELLGVRTERPLLEFYNEMHMMSFYTAGQLRGIIMRALGEWAQAVQLCFQSYDNYLRSNSSAEPIRPDLPMLTISQLSSQTTMSSMLMMGSRMPAAAGGRKPKTASRVDQVLHQLRLAKMPADSTGKKLCARSLTNECHRSAATCFASHDAKILSKKQADTLRSAGLLH